MDSQDDPEARIRDLERQLEESSRASEVSGAQPGSTHPTGPAGSVGPSGPPPLQPPPLSYHDPYSDTSRRSSGNNRMWWILAASVVGVLVLAGGLAVYVAHQSVTTSVVVSPTPSAGPSTPSQGQQLSISGVKQNRTITCNDNIVTVSGDSNTVVISGHCTSLKVSGIKNSVTVDAVDTISASGFDNKITYRSGTPKITNSGLRNVVQQG